jgi:hydroxyacylglutathione hydrolase
MRRDQEQDVITDRIFTPGLAQVAYLIADEEAGEVAIIDPRRDVDVYVNWAEERGLRYVAILETHVHADFVSGGPELARVTGAPVYASRRGDVEYDHIPIDDGDVIRVGSARLKAVWTPGHTPEHVAFLLLPNPDNDTPVSLYSGDVLFVGDVGRPDLLGQDATQELGKQLYTTVTERLKPLPNDVVVYPGHTAGSSCGKKIGDAPSTTIGAEKLGNYAFQPDERDEFVEQVLKDMPAPPAYYPVLKKINKTGAPMISSLPEPEAMSASDVRTAISDGVLVVDTRSSGAYGEGHIPGAVFAGYGANFHAWMGWLAPYDRDLVIVGGGEGTVAEIVTALRQIGIDRVTGYLEGGMDAWDGEVSTLPQMDVESLSRNLDNYDVLDARNPDEWKDGHIEGADHLPAYEIIGGEMPSDEGRTKPLAVICGSGYRSSVASSVLMARGLKDVVNIDGGMSAWNDAGLPVAPQGK